MRLEAGDLRVGLGGREVLRGVSVAFERAEMVGIVGPNGSGKSTLVRTLAGVLRPAGGAVLLDGRPVGRLSRRRLARSRGLLAQAGEIPPLTTVAEHVAMGRHAHRPPLSRPRPDDADAVHEAMARCEVLRLAERRLDELSGGERQRVRIATLLAQDPPIMLLDEPLAGLDIEHQLALLRLLGDLHSRDGRTVVCVLHDLDLALRFFPRIVVIHEGRVAADGHPRRVLTPELFREVFRVEGRVGCECAGHPVTVCDGPCPAAAVVRDGPFVQVRHTLSGAPNGAHRRGVSHGKQVPIPRG